MDNKLKNTGINCLYFIISFAVIVLISLFIYPLKDDWFYLTTPNTHFNLLEAIKPTEVFWRPLDAIFGGLLGKAPYLFPYANRIAVTFAHVFSAFLLDKILTIFDYKKIVRLFTVIIFTFSSAAVIVVTSPDALNQSFCVLFGALGMYFYLRKDNFIYLIFVAISILWKESGITFLAIIPLAGFMKNVPDFKYLKKDSKPIKKLAVCAAAAIAFAAVYFSLRFYLLGEVVLGVNRGRYEISVFSFSTIKNLVNMLLFSMTGIDSAAVFVEPKNYLLAGITALLSAAFLIYIFICFIKMIKSGKGFLRFSVILLIIILLAAPQSVIEKAGEMHAYPVLFGVSMLYGFLLNYSEKKDIRKEISVFICLLTAFVISSAHKYILIYDYSEQAKRLNDTLYTYYKDSSEELILINIKSGKPGYSVFYQEPVDGTCDGQSLKQYFDWETLNIKKVDADDTQEANKIAEYCKTNENIVLIINGTSVKELK